MAGWDRYRLETLDAVFAESGVRTLRPESGAGMWTWSIEREGHHHIATYEDRSEGIAAIDVEFFSRNLGLDPGEVFRLLDSRGGRILDV